MLMAYGSFIYPYKMNNFRSGSASNGSNTNDSRVADTYYEIWGNFFDEDYCAKLYKDLVPYMLDQAWAIRLPPGYGYTVWQPWLKNYHGERQVGFSSDNTYAQFIWIDQDLKQQIRGKR